MCHCHLIFKDKMTNLHTRDLKASSTLTLKHTPKTPILMGPTTIKKTLNSNHPLKKHQIFQTNIKITYF